MRCPRRPAARRRRCGAPPIASRRRSPASSGRSRSISSSSSRSAPRGGRGTRARARASSSSGGRCSTAPACSACPNRVAAVYLELAVLVRALEGLATAASLDALPDRSSLWAGLFDLQDTLLGRRSTTCAHSPRERRGSLSSSDPRLAVKRCDEPLRRDDAGSSPRPSRGRTPSETPGPRSGTVTHPGVPEAVAGRLRASIASACACDSASFSEIRASRPARRSTKIFPGP